jgi:tetratricopeptide (TPR) repeat protein
MESTPTRIAERPGSAVRPPPLIEQMFDEAVRRHSIGQAAEAEAVYRAILALQPTHAAGSYNLGLICHMQGRADEAVAAYRHAIAVHAGYLDAYCNLGAALQGAGRKEEAVAVFRQALAINPDYAVGHLNLGVALKELGRPEEAEASFRRAIQIRPDYEMAYANLAGVLLDRDDPEAAIAACQKAIAINPGEASAHGNLGLANAALCRMPEAEAAFRRAIALSPDFVEAHFTLAQSLLVQGRMEEGWAEYDWRWKLPAYSWRRGWLGDVRQPQWAGEPLTGRRILVYAEQGQGDSIQYVRYLPAVARMAARVTLAVHPPLKTLFQGIGGVNVISLDESHRLEFDVHCPLLTLPRLFGTRMDTIPCEIPYLRPSPIDIARWKARLPAGRPRVAVVWAGSPTHTNDRRRSPRLARMQRLFDVPGIEFISLQVGAGRDELATTRLPAHVRDLGAEVRDFADTAAILDGVDLLVSADTAPLHLAGAMGVPVWGMIPYHPHFAWLMHRSDSPWYPSLRLYRQEAPTAGWDGVLTRIEADLAALARERAA